MYLLIVSMEGLPPDIPQACCEILMPLCCVCMLCVNSSYVVSIVENRAIGCVPLHHSPNCLLFLTIHPTALGSIPEKDQSFIASRHTSPAMRRPRSSQSDHTMSSSDGSPVRKPRPHSIAGRLPSYATPTVSSSARTGRNPDKKITGKV